MRERGADRVLGSRLELGLWREDADAARQATDSPSLGRGGGRPCPGTGPVPAKACIVCHPCAEARGERRCPGFALPLLWERATGRDSAASLALPEPRRRRFQHVAHACLSTAYPWANVLASGTACAAAGAAGAVGPTGPPRDVRVEAGCEVRGAKGEGTRTFPCRGLVSMDEGGSKAKGSCTDAREVSDGGGGRGAKRRAGRLVQGT